MILTVPDQAVVSKGNSSENGDLGLEGIASRTSKYREDTRLRRRLK